MQYLSIPFVRWYLYPFFLYLQLLVLFLLVHLVLPLFLQLYFLLRTIISTLRFLFLPSSDVLSAIGEYSPYPNADNLDGDIFLVFNMYEIMFVALAVDNSQFDGYCELFIGVASVCPSIITGLSILVNTCNISSNVFLASFFILAEPASNKIVLLTLITIPRSSSTNIIFSLSIKLSSKNFNKSSLLKLTFELYFGSLFEVNSFFVNCFLIS